MDVGHVNTSIRLAQQPLTTLEVANTANMNLLEATLLGYLVSWTICIAIWLLRVNMFMRPRYKEPISHLESFVELMNHYLCPCFLVSLFIDWCIAGPSLDAISAETQLLWRMSVFHTSILGDLAFIRFMRTHIRFHFGRYHPGIVLVDEMLSFFFVAVVAVACITGSVAVFASFPSADTITSGGS